MGNELNYSTILITNQKLILAAVERRKCMLKVMFVEHSLAGHRKKYLQYLNDNSTSDILSYTLLLSDENISDKAINKISCEFDEKRNILNYYKVINIVKMEADKNQVDIIHFLDGDLYYRFFGILLQRLKKFKVIMTFHHLYTYGWRQYAIKRIFSKITAGIVHTEYLRKTMQKSGIENVEHIEYPVFQYENMADINVIGSKEKWKQPIGIPVIGCIGGTQRYKGLNILLEALKSVDVPFHLLIAGKEADFSREYIENEIQTYKNSVSLVLRHLTDEEYMEVVAASDIIALPYLKEFNGASGPLADGVCMGKIIVGSNYGSLGYLIEYNRIGKTFEAENPRALSKILNEVLREGYNYNEMAMKYQQELRPQNFANRYRKLYYKLAGNK